MKGLQFPL